MSPASQTKYVTAEYQILRALESADSPVGFNALEKRAGVSSRTLAKHLGRLVPKLVHNVKGKYDLTNDGRRYKAEVESQLDEWRRRRRSNQPPEEIVEVYSVGPSYTCRGRFVVSCHGKLQERERESLDRALTEAIRTVKSAIPNASRTCRVSINWSSRQ
jgi:DNA-binding HxlR family transcriptional regulator